MLTDEPPSDVVAERAVLGAMLESPTAIAEVLDVLAAEHFYDPLNVTLFGVIVELYAAGIVVDLPVMLDALRRRGLLVPGRLDALYLNGLVEHVSVGNAGYYARTLADLALRRDVLDRSTKIHQMAGNQSTPIAEVVDRAQSWMYSLTDQRATEKVVSVTDLGDPTVEALVDLEGGDGKAAGVPTGFRDLDRLTTGLHPERMVVVAARPGMGKSTLALNIAKTVAIDHDRPTIFFSLEMPRVDLMIRLYSSLSRVSLSAMRGGRMTDEQWTAVLRAKDRIEGKPLWIDDTVGLSPSSLHARCRRLKQQHGLGLVTVDYMQKLITGRRESNRQQQVAEISQSMTELARDLHVPVLALSQLNRGLEQRTDKTPVLSDIRESGAIEADADVVVLLHRDEARQGETDLIVAKNRHGDTGTVPVAFQGHFGRFIDMGTDTF
jgi:replicative DNA helicase